jgi:hypothetical protein
MQELLPIFGGLFAGALIGVRRPPLPLRAGVPIAIGLGALATILSGELRISWAFLLVDVSTAALSGIAGLLAVRWLQPVSRNPR